MTAYDPDDRDPTPPRRRVMALCDHCGQVKDVAVYDGPVARCYECDECQGENDDA